MAVILVIALLIRSNLKTYPSKLQAFGEVLYDFCRSLTYSTAGKRGDGYMFYIGSLFLFIMTANLMGQLPLRLIHLPHGELIAPTGDFNTPAALAVMTLLVYLTVGIKRKGLSYFKHYLFPNFVFLPLNLLEDVTRPFSLALRLYANILVGEILAMIALSMVPYVAPVAVIFFELFVAVIQAYIFAVLSSVYIALVTAEEH